ncbi:DEAD/DEAH box helicase [Methanocaldococcus sp.]
MKAILNEFNNLLMEKFGFSLRTYQEYVIKDIINSVSQGNNFIVVSMPTGSGKTLIEIFTAHYALKTSKSRILVLEPTRFLCDQMYSKLWSKLFDNIVGKEYEGNCSSFLDANKKIVISTPQTALKCATAIKEEFNVVIINEIHHAFGGKHYRDLLVKLNPNFVFGFTALLPSKKRYSLDTRVQSLLGEPTILNYDFKKLSEIDPSFQPPKAIADLFDAEMNEIEETVYNNFFCGNIPGDPRAIKFLENTLVRYGKRAFCESLKRAIVKNRILEYDSDSAKLCNSNEPSHKARALCEIFLVYDVKNNDSLKPIIVFTSRKATAYEFKEVIVRSIGLSTQKVEVLTSDMSKEERLNLMKRAKEGHVDVIISTLVGEEGVDIPEAGLLIMSDTPKSPLRFYQRLGRLIRLASPKKIKYLVLTLTPKTREYGDVEEALWNLYSEGVDVNYIIYNLNEKGPELRILDILDKFSNIYNDVAIPYTLITLGRVISDPITYLLNIAKSDENFIEDLKNMGFNIESDEDLSNLFFLILTSPWLRGYVEIKRILKNLDKQINKGSFSEVLDKAIYNNHVFYIYDVELLSDFIFKELKRLYDDSKSEGITYCENAFFRLDRKSILKLFMKIFPFKLLDNIKERLKDLVHTLEENLKNFKENKYYSLRIDYGRYNDKNKSLSSKIIISVSVDVRIYLEAHINYYNISIKNEETYKKIRELITLNLLAIGYRSIEKFFELYEETTS